MAQDRPKAGTLVNSDDWMGNIYLADQVLEDRDPKYTGLLDASGAKIYRVIERVPFGFQPPKK